MRATMQRLAARYGASALMILAVVLMTALAADPVAADNACQPYKVEC